MRECARTTPDRDPSGKATRERRRRILFDDVPMRCTASSLLLCGRRRASAVAGDNVSAFDAGEIGYHTALDSAELQSPSTMGEVLSGFAESGWDVHSRSMANGRPPARAFANDA